MKSHASGLRAFGAGRTMTPDSRLQRTACKRSMFRRFALALALCGSLASCGGGDNLPEDFTAAKNAWEASGVLAYRFTLGQACLCPSEKGSPVVVVRDGKVVSARYADGTFVDGAQLQRLPSMSDIFAAMEAAYARGLLVRFTANRPYGDLSEVYIDYIKEAADDELWYIIRDFTLEEP